jgi:hypothetical protein
MCAQPIYYTVVPLVRLVPTDNKELLGSTSLSRLLMTTPYRERADVWLPHMRSLWMLVGHMFTQALTRTSHIVATCTCVDHAGTSSSACRRPTLRLARVTLSTSLCPSSRGSSTTTAGAPHTTANVCAARPAYCLLCVCVGVCVMCV